MIFGCRPSSKPPASHLHPSDQRSAPTSLWVLALRIHKSRISLLVSVVSSMMLLLRFHLVDMLEPPGVHTCAFTPLQPFWSRTHSLSSWKPLNHESHWSSLWTFWLSPPHLSSPHVTIVPSPQTAMKAPSVGQICFTSFSWLWTASLLPPAFALPQVTTPPSLRRAANAPYKVA